MPDVRRTLSKIPLIMNGQALLGIVFVLAGAVVVREGFVKIRELWVEFAPYFPMTLPGTALPRILEGLPLIVLVFIVLISSVCGVLIGLLWTLSGLVDIIQSRRKRTVAGDLMQPELVAEAVRTAQAQYWQSSSWWVRAFVRLWPKARMMSPVSHEILGDVVGYLLRLTLLVLAVALATYLLHFIPSLAKRFLQINVVLTVPSASPLYFILAAMMLLNVIIGASVVPVRRREFFRECEPSVVKGSGSISLFFALVEEACTLLNPKRTAQKLPVRLEERQGLRARGTFIESRPQLVRSLARPAGYCCLPLAFLLCTMGFSRLVNFQRPVATMHYADFLAIQLPDYIVEVLFALGLIFAGLHIAEWARRIFGIQRFRSSAVLCHTLSSRTSEADLTPPGPMRSIKWSAVQGVDEEFLGWAREPGKSDRYDVTICWADILTEAAGPQNPRFVIDMVRSESLDEAMERIIQLPFRANFQAEMEEYAPAPPGPSRGNTNARSKN